MDPCWYKLNRSFGTLEDLLGILALLYQKEPEVLIHEHQPNFMAFTFVTMPKTPIKVLLAIIRSACPVTTRSIFVQGNGHNTALFDESTFSQSNFCELIKESIL
ncbi:MAG: hypothetical protein BWZ03_00388 [bacterium ADurb.BinA186]|nr:MAG: hypothetical protein BWZ03_00388 [bacterium ADurb.BinA186]